MRYPHDHREKTRQRILEAAATVFRRQGFQAAGVDAIMAEAGLTAGGFYSHFSSKEDLFAAAFQHALAGTSPLKSVADQSAGTDVDSATDELAATGQAGRVRAMARKYLSLPHRRMIDAGCPLPPLLADLPRQNAALRESFERELAQTAAGLQAQLPHAQQVPDQSWALLALLVGGVTLARAVEDEQTADRILKACQALVDTALESPPSVADPPKKQPSKKTNASSKPRKKGSPRS